MNNPARVPIRYFLLWCALATLLFRPVIVHALTSYEEFCRGIQFDGQVGNNHNFSNGSGQTMTITTGQTVTFQQGNIRMVSTGSTNLTFNFNDVISKVHFRFASISGGENYRHYISSNGGTSYLDFTGQFTVNLAQVTGNPNTYLVPQGSSTANYRLLNDGYGGGGSQAAGVMTIIPAVNYMLVDGLVGSPYGRNYAICEFDLGDGLSSYGNARHLYKWGTASAGLAIGSAVEPEGTALYSANADGDDDDGVVLPTMERGRVHTIPISVIGAGYLQAFFDWNGDGDFNDSVDGISETVAIDIPSTGGGAQTITISVSVPSAATTALTLARFRYSSETGIGASGDAIDGEVEDYAVTFTTPAPLLTATKSVRPFDSNNIYGSANASLYSVPNTDVIYSLTMQNQGNLSVQSNSLFLVNQIPDMVEFYHADMDAGGMASGAVVFIDNGSGLSFDPASNVGYSSNVSVPVNAGQCTYTPAIGYDPLVKYICISPSGAFGFGDPDPSATFEYRARLK